MFVIMVILPVLVLTSMEPRLVADLDHRRVPLLTAYFPIAVELTTYTAVPLYDAANRSWYVFTK